MGGRIAFQCSRFDRLPDLRLGQPAPGLGYRGHVRLCACTAPVAGQHGSPALARCGCATRNSMCHIGYGDRRRRWSACRGRGLPAQRGAASRRRIRGGRGGAGRGECAVQWIRRGLHLSCAKRRRSIRGAAVSHRAPVGVVAGVPPAVGRARTAAVELDPGILAGVLDDDLRQHGAHRERPHRGHPRLEDRDADPVGALPDGDACGRGSSVLRSTASARRPGCRCG